MVLEVAPNVGLIFLMKDLLGLLRTPFYFYMQMAPIHIFQFSIFHLLHRAIRIVLGAIGDT